MNPETRFRKSTLSSAVLFALGVQGAALMLPGGGAQASLQACADQNASQLNTDRANFTMLDSAAGIVGGTNDVSAMWDGTVYTDSSDYTGPGGATPNATMSSTWPFFSYTWTAHDIQVFAPGSYSFDTTLGGGAPETGTLNVTVPAGKLGMHMLFDWASSTNIDVFIVVDQNTVFGSGIGTKVVGTTCTFSNKNCLWTGKGYAGGNVANAPAGSTVWMLSSIDGNGDNIMGIPMPAGGPFAGFNANFNFNFATAPTFTPGTVCNPTADITPDPFFFTDVTGATPSTAYVSNTITVTGLGSGVSSPISIGGGEYSVNGGAYSTNTPATVMNGDTVTLRQTSGANEDGTKTDATLSIGGVSDTYSVTTIDKKADAFSFTSQTDVATSTVVESNTITISGMDSGETTPVNISGGEYSVDGGITWSSTTNAVSNGDTIKVRQTSSANGATTTIATLTLGSAANGTLVSGDFSVRTSGGVTTINNNFTMLDPSGGVTGGTNDVAMDWDQQFNTSVTDPVTPASAHMHLSSVTPFFQYPWTAHHIQVFGPGTYVINVDCTTTQYENGTCTPNSDPSKNYTFTVGAGQIGAHMLFNWNTSTNIDVVDIWNQGAVFAPSPLYTGPTNCANAAQSWDLMSADWDGDGQNGAKMIDGPFNGFSANFNILMTTPAQSCTSYTPTVNVGDPNTPGCSISSAPVSALKRADWWIVGGFLAWLGGIRMRRKRTRS